MRRAAIKKARTGRAFLMVRKQDPQSPLKPNNCAERRRYHRGNAPKNAPRWLPLAHLPSFRTMAQAPPNAPPTCRLSPSLYPRRSSGGGRETQQRASPHPTDTTPPVTVPGPPGASPSRGIRRVIAGQSQIFRQGVVLVAGWHRTAMDAGCLGQAASPRQARDGKSLTQQGFSGISGVSGGIRQGGM